MAFFEAVRLALSTIRVQKLKSFFTLIGVTIGVMFLIAVVSIVEGMSRYVEEDFAGKLFGVNTFTARQIADSVPFAICTACAFWFQIFNWSQTLRF